MGKFKRLSSPHALTDHHAMKIYRMSGSIPPLHQYSLMTWCSVKAQGQLYLYLLPLVVHTRAREMENDRVTQQPKGKEDEARV